MLAERKPFGTLDPNITRVQPRRAAKTDHKWLANRKVQNLNIANNFYTKHVNPICLYANNLNEEKMKSSNKENCDNYKEILLHNQIIQHSANVTTIPHYKNVNVILQEKKINISSFQNISNNSVNMDSDAESSQSRSHSLDIDVIIKRSKPKNYHTEVLDEYVESMLEYMKETEIKYIPSKDYLRLQTEITAQMRVKLIDWLVEVQDEYKLQNETLHLACGYVDRFLSVMFVTSSRLQLLGTTAMFVAAKFEEIYPPDSDEFAYVTDDTYTRSEVLMMERLMMRVFNCSFAITTSHQFLDIFYDKSSVSRECRDLARYLIELALLEEDYLNFTPSVKAASALSVAVCTLQNIRNCDIANGNCHSTSQQFDYLISKVVRKCMLENHKQIYECAKKLALTHLEAYSGTHFVREKYLLPCRHHVAKLQPVLSENSFSNSMLNWNNVMGIWMM